MLASVHEHSARTASIAVVVVPVAADAVALPGEAVHGGADQDRGHAPPQGNHLRPAQELLDHVSTGEALTSLIALTLIYLVLAVVEVGLLLKFIRAGADPFVEPPDPSLREQSDEPLTFAY